MLHRTIKWRRLGCMDCRESHGLACVLIDSYLSPNFDVLKRKSPFQKFAACLIGHGYLRVWLSLIGKYKLTSDRHGERRRLAIEVSSFIHVSPSLSSLMMQLANLDRSFGGNHVQLLFALFKFLSRIKPSPFWHTWPQHSILEIFTKS